MTAALAAGGGWAANVLAKTGDPWFLFGMAGQCAFGARFVVQWIASERRKRVVVPVAFWWLSIAGGLVTLAYAVRIEDPVFLIAQTGGLAMYLRNLVLHRRSGAGAAAA
jgi:lipid-A-disaccharide synthase-like uncharacterized protein